MPLSPPESFRGSLILMLQPLARLSQPPGFASGGGGAALLLEVREHRLDDVAGEHLAAPDRGEHIVDR